MSNGVKQTKDDRREFFRVNDAVRLTIRKVAEQELPALLECLEQNITGNFTILSSLSAISAEMAASMRRIEINEPDVAAYLKALDRKIEVLGRALIASESELIVEEAHPVNLSAGGMGMLVGEEYQAGQSVEIKMLLFPSFTGVLIYGTVIDCSPLAPEETKDGYSYRMRIEFTHMREQDRDLVIRHVLRCQSNELRRRDPAHRVDGD
jgi:hypothetical protein